LITATHACLRDNVSQFMLEKDASFHIAQSAVETLDVTLLHRPACLDVDQPDLPVLGPASIRWEANPVPLSE